MADSTHLQLLRAGQEGWNQWRKDHPAVVPDLNAADLREWDLERMNLRGAGLSEADLSGAKLTGAHLDSCDLSRATLDRAEMTGADLQKANAKAASFKTASMVRVNLVAANLERANLRGASLNDAEFGGTILVDTDLTGANYLETCRFWAPVGIDFRTMVRSTQLPVPFLRGCGIPEQVIETLPALSMKEIEYYSVLIRSAKEDESFAERLEADLSARGIRCWRVKVLPNEPAGGLEVRLEDSLKVAETRLLVVLSRNSTRARTPWIERDVKIWMQNERAHNRKLFFGVRTDDSRMAITDPASEQELNRRTVDFRRWKERKFYFDAVDRLAKALSS